MNRITERMKKMADSPSEWFDHFAQAAFGQIGILAEIDANIENDKGEKQTRDYPGTPASIKAYCEGCVEFEKNELTNFLGYPMEGEAWKDFVAEVKRRCESIKSHADFNNIFAYGLDILLDKEIIQNLDSLAKDKVSVKISSREDALLLSFEYEATN